MLVQGLQPLQSPTQHYSSYMERERDRQRERQIENKSRCLQVYFSRTHKHTHEFSIEYFCYFPKEIKSTALGNHFSSTVHSYWGLKFLLSFFFFFFPVPTHPSFFPALPA